MSDNEGCKDSARQPNEMNDDLRGPWREEVFKARDAVDYRNVCGIPFYGPASGAERDDPRVVIIPGGWDHEHCEGCGKTISEAPHAEQVGFTNGEDWLCRGCYEERVLRNQPSW